MNKISTLIKRTWVIALVCLCSMVDVSGQIVNFHLAVRHDCDRNVNLLVLLRKSDLSSEELELGNFSTVIKFDPEVYQYSGYVTRELDPRTAVTTKNSNWSEQKWTVDEENGLFSLATFRKSTEPNPFALSEKYIVVGTLTLTVPEGIVDIGEIKAIPALTSCYSENNLKEIAFDGFPETRLNPKWLFSEPEVEVESAISECGFEGASVTFNFPNKPYRSHLRFSLDGGRTYEDRVSESLETVTYDSLPSGTYHLFTKWVTGECITDLGTVDLNYTTLNVIPQYRVADDPWVTGEDEVLICEGQRLYLSANPNTQEKYEWEGPNGFSKLGNVNGTVLVTNSITADDAGIYKVTVTNEESCVVVKKITVKVYENPTVSVSDLQASCSGIDGSISLNYKDVGIRTTIEFSVDGGITFPYNTLDELEAYKIEGLAGGDYSIYARWGNNDCAVFVKDVAIEGPLTLTTQHKIDDNPWGVDEDLIIACEGNKLYLSAAPNALTSYLWEGPNGFSKAGNVNGTILLSNSVTADDSGAYKVTATNDEGCTTVKKITIKVYENPTVSISQLQPSCGGANGSVALSYKDVDVRTSIEFSVDGGLTYLYNTRDEYEAYTIEGLAAGNYSIYSRWGNNDCAVFVGNAQINETSRTPGAVCDDGDPATLNDVIQEDGCTCAGATLCGVAYEITGNTVNIENLSAEIVFVKIFTSSWSQVYECSNFSTACGETISTTIDQNGTYFLQIKTYEDWSTPLCDIFETIEVLDEGNCNSLTDGGQIKVSNAESVCLGQAAPPIYNETYPSGANGELEYMWLSSTSSCPNTIGQKIDGANLSTLEPGVLTETTYFRRLSRIKGCQDNAEWFKGESNCLKIEVEECQSGCQTTYSIVGNELKIENVRGAIRLINVIDANWNYLFNCSPWNGTQCDSEINVTLPSSGTYMVQIQTYEDWSTPICSIVESFNYQENLQRRSILGAFSATGSEKSVKLDWTIVDGAKVEHFELERSKDGVTFESIGTIQNENDTNEQTFYQNLDEFPLEGFNFYRLKILIDEDTYEYSDIESVKIYQVEDFGLFPNPANNVANVSLQNFQDKNVDIQIVDIYGKAIQNYNLENINQPFLQIDLGEFQNGVYYVWVVVENRRPVTKKLIVRKSY